MAIGSSTSGLQPATQAAWQQIKLQQAKREADRAEQNAQSLQEQAQAAQRTADRAQDTARSLSIQADQAQSEAGRARQGLASLSSLGQMEALLTHTTDQTLQRQQGMISKQAQASGSPAKSPVINTQGQVTGAVVNTTA